MKTRIEDLMDQSGVRFGTSGARGLAADMTDRVCYVYTIGFLQHLESIGEAAKGMPVAVAGDFRPSTDLIMAAVARAAADFGYQPLNCGKIPSPAVALKGLSDRIPAVMVTGSHIPSDRNGIKFNKGTGEILKVDEEGIRRQTVSVEDSLFDADGCFVRKTSSLPAVDDSAGKAYIARYLDFFPSDALAGVKLGIYQHSSVGRDMMAELYGSLGADISILGRSDTFIPVDTEAIREEDAALAARWCGEQELFGIVSADGDADRPLISDEKGVWLRGDVAGILVAKYLGADSVSTPVSCNSAVEKCGCFREIRRTRIGSPYVIEAMDRAVRSGARMAVGYEANGGFLTNSPLTRGDGTLAALPTRDAVIVHLSILLLAREEGMSISRLAGSLPRRFTASDRLKDYPVERSRAVLGLFNTGSEETDVKAAEKIFGDLCGKVASIDRTDGIRITFGNSEIIHLRPSGNAPEFRCYTEAGSNERALSLNVFSMEKLKKL